MMRCLLYLSCLYLPLAWGDSLLQDPAFRYGARIAALQVEQVDGLRRARIEGTLQPAGQQQSPAWMLVQWGSRASLHGGTAGCEGRLCRRLQHDGRELKAIAIGLPDADLQLRTDGLAEFSGRYPRTDPYLQKGEHWPHLLVSQPLRSRPLADYRQLRLRFEARLDADDPQRQAGHDAGIHAARFVVAFTLRNRFTHDFLWLTLPVYDDRWPRSPHGCRQCLPGPDGEPDCVLPETPEAGGSWQCPHDAVRDAAGNTVLGSSRMLFRLPSSAFAAAPLQPGVWVMHDVDLKPWLLAALAAAAGQGEAGFRVQPQDFRLASVSLGWEVSGLNRVSLSLRGLALDGLR